MADNTSEAIRVAQQYRTALLSAEGEVIEDILAYWEAIEADLEAEIAAFAETIESGRHLTTSQLLRLERYQDLLASLQVQIAAYEATITPVLENGQALAVGLGSEYATAVIRTLTQGTAVGYTTPELAVEAIVALARAGKPLSELMAGAYGEAAIALTDHMIAGIAKGLGPREIARVAARRGLAGRALNRYLVITRDQWNRSFRFASHEYYKATGVVRAWRRVSARDSRTCLACWALDGKEYGINSFFSSHPVCRCTLLPVIRGLDMRLEHGRDLFVGLSASQQRRVMGKGRFDLWQANRDKLDFDDFVTWRPSETWGASAVPTPLYRLAEKVGK